jgi:hypothetical protein
MIDTKELRRLAEEQQWIGRWYDAGCETLMAERNGEHEEVAHLTPIGLVPYLVAVQPAAIIELLDRLEAAEKERDELRAKIAEMEKQEPVAWVRKLGLDLPSTGCVTDLKYRPSDIPESSYIPLYLAPGAQPAPSVPDDMMRDAERYRYLRARDEETAGVGCWLEAKGRACDRGWLYGVQLDSAIDSFIEMLAAAPEAKP